MFSSNSLAEDFTYLIHHSVDYRSATTPENLQRTCSICLNLLTQLPSAREAIFDYFNSLISIGVHCFIQKDPLIASVSDLLNQIETKLISLANQSSSWANILAQWSIDQLFHLTQRYATDPIVKQCDKRDDRVQLWTQCQAAMTLIKIGSACISHDTRAADNALNKYLIASILSQPIFDWVTVSLSLRCAQILVSRLIQMSLQELDQSQAIKGIPRIFAIWSSLDIIAEQEPHIFHQALMERIQILLNSNDPHKQSSITLFIRMTSAVAGPLSDIVYYSLYRSLNSLSLRRLCVSIRQTKTMEEIEQLSKEFLDGLMSVQTDAFQIIQFILNFIPADQSTDNDEIELTLRDCCQYLLRQLCHECHYKFRLQKDHQRPKIPILSALRSSFEQLLSLLNLTKHPEKKKIIQDLCFNVALYHGDDIMMKYLPSMLTSATDLLQDVVLEFEYYHPNCIRDAILFIFEENDPKKVTQCLQNLHQLILVNEQNKIQPMIWSLIDQFSRLLSDLSLSSIQQQLILEILLQLNIYMDQPSYEQMIQLACSLTDTHMKILEMMTDASLMDRLLLWRDTLLHLIDFSNSEFHLFTLITLVDFLIPRLNVDENNVQQGSDENFNSLLEQNMSMANLNPNRVFSRSFKRPLGHDRFIKIPVEFTDQYTILMIDIFNELLLHESSLLVSLATTLIDNILPDSTIDNQFDDEQCKVPNERNLALIRRLDEQPMIWILFELITADSNAFQLCLPVVRCVLSSLIVQWENIRGEDRAMNHIKQLNLSINLIILLKKARFLPIPLNEIYELFPLITAYDCFTLLSNIWNYLKQNQQLFINRSVPPASVLRDSQYSDPIRFVIQKNVADIGSIAEHFLSLRTE